MKTTEEAVAAVPPNHQGVLNKGVSKRPTLMIRSVFLNWRRAQWTACFIAMMTIVHPARSQQTKPAEPDVAAANRAVQSQLPFSDRQDFEDAMRGFIATTPDPRDPDRYAFLKYEAPPTVNPVFGVRRNSTSLTDCLRSPTAFIRFAVSRRRI
jgi:hypothetical protein